MYGGGEGGTVRINAVDGSRLASPLAAPRQLNHCIDPAASSALWSPSGTQAEDGPSIFTANPPGCH